MDVKRLFAHMSTKNKYIVIHFLFSTFYNDGRVKTYYNYLKKEGITTYVISIGDKKELEDVFSLDLVEKYQGNNLFRYIWLFIKFFRFSIKTLKHIMKVNPGREFILHFHNMPNIIDFISIPFKSRPIRVIIDNHDLLPLLIKEKFNSSILYGITKVEQYLSHKIADHIICADHNQLEYITQTGIDANKVTAILNVANPKIFESQTIPGNSGFNLVYHGTISKRLGIDLIIDALSKAVKVNKKIKFNLIGEGDYLEEIKNKVNMLNLSDNIIIKDKFVPLEELPKIISEMDVGIIGNRLTLLSDYMLPVKLIEYVYMQKPVIAPKNAIISKYFKDDMVCFYEPENVDEMAEKMLYLCNNRETRQKYAHNALEFTKRYNYSTEMGKYQRVINDLLVGQTIIE
ncbi:MAG: glycosyltransferase [Candidatus Thorarchaeota archaeon]